MASIRVSHEKKFLRSVICLAMTLLFRFGARSALEFYMAFEAGILPAGYLILGWGRQPERLPARAYFALYTVGARLPFLVLLFSVKRSLGHLSFYLPYWGRVHRLP